MGSAQFYYNIGIFVNYGFGIDIDEEEKEEEKTLGSH